jgi:hypothetical protein
MAESGWSAPARVAAVKDHVDMCAHMIMIVRSLFMPQQSSLKDRVNVLEKELASLKARVDGKPGKGKPWWIELFGVFKDDPLFEEAMKLGAEYRESLRPKPRKKRAGKHVPSGH